MSEEKLLQPPENCNRLGCLKLAECAVGVEFYPPKAVMDHYQKYDRLFRIILGLRVCREHVPTLEDMPVSNFEEFIPMIERKTGTVVDRPGTKIVAVEFGDPDYIILTQNKHGRQMKGKCVWVIETWKPNPGAAMTPPVYCHKPTKYKMVEDDDGNKVRRYESFCDEHVESVNNQLADEYYDT